MTINISQRPTAEQMLKALDEILQKQTKKVNAIKTPNGALVTNPEDLGLWCQANWQIACRWLEGKLPDLIENAWFDAQLSTNMRDIRSKYHADINIALDLCIDMLNPTIKRTSNLQIQPMPINFGNIRLSRSLILKNILLCNTGERYLGLTISSDDWLIVNPEKSWHQSIEVGLMPNETQTIPLYANTNRTDISGTIKSTLTIQSANGINMQIPVQAHLPFWKTLFDRNRIFKVKSVPQERNISIPQSEKGKSGIFSTLFSIILLCVCCGLTVNSLDKELSGSASARPTSTVSSSADEPAIAQEDIPTLPQSSLQNAQITGVQSLNIRSSSNADSNNNIIGVLGANDVFQLTGIEENGWYEIQFGEIRGWVNSKYVKQIP